MLRAIVRLFTGALFALGALSVVFLVGMRSKSPTVLNAVRRASRAAKPRVLRTAGQPGASASVVRHTGRKSGQSYETPIGTHPTEDGFLIALPYGPETDWLKNVLAAGSATIVADGKTYTVDQPEVVPTATVMSQLPEGEQRTLRLFRVQEHLRVRREEAPDQAMTSTASP